MTWKSLTVPMLLICLTLGPAFARKKKVQAPVEKPVVVAPMPDDEKILHALNRLAFGPRPGDVEQVREMGLKQWIDQQLHPESIPENPVLESKLEPLDTLRLSTSEMIRKYPPNFLVKQMVDGKIPWPEDPQTRMVVQKVAERYQDKLGLPGNAQQAPTYDQALAELTPPQRQVLEAGAPAQDKIAMLAALPLPQQFDVIESMPGGQRQKLFAAAPAPLRRQMEMFAGTQTLVNQDLMAAKIFRAVYSNRQLEEVLTDFWFNHFNVYLDKGADRYEVTAYERDAIRPFVLGKFKDMLVSTAQSPAMLFYLDNFQSVRPDMDAHNPNAKKAKRGLNENYGRELMELQTLGVDGGYTQKDVTEVARCFTGWTIREPRRGGGFEFNEKQHDPGEKHVLGVTIPAHGGVDDGYKVLDILAHHPSTARFISKSLAVRFVSDNPPQALVDRMAATFTSTGGDLRDVMKTMLDSPEFWSQDAWRSKIKSPFEMVVSSLRATGADIDFTTALGQQLNQLGEPLYRKQEPTGYSNKSSEWMNSAALLGRLNFAMNLTSNHVGGVKVTLPDSTDPQAMARSLIGEELTADSRRIVENGLTPPPAPAPADNAQPPAVKATPFRPPTPALVAGLTLGSPDFQRR
jgi:uncharacterized protein (DUF1800 family)